MHDGTLKVSDFGLARKLYQELYHKNVSSRVSAPATMGWQPRRAAGDTMPALLQPYRYTAAPASFIVLSCSASLPHLIDLTVLPRFQTRLPLKWMALESIEKHDFDSQTDV